ncbi:indolepyruvate ferredoxin oxidoreductase family protein [soil metagenome]
MNAPVTPDATAVAQPEAPLDQHEDAVLDDELPVVGAPRDVTLDDKYSLDRGTAYMSGTQALVRLPMLQKVRDDAVGLNTGGFISGYRGSPLGGVDQALWKAKKYLKQHRIEFQPGLNEDLAATAVWGSQQVTMSPQATVDGVFAMWYGKGPGVDRSGDVFKHANAAGSSKHGGVLVLAGDDHSAKSSTLPHQSDHIFKACGIPTFFPSTVQEYLDLGLHGWAMSRYSGLWVGMKTVTDVVESSASVVIDPDRVQIVLPDDFQMPADGLNIRWPDSPLQQEARLLDYKFYAMLAYVRANKLNYNVIDSPNARFGIISSGKAWLDTRQALQDLGLDDDTCRRIGIRLHKVNVVWPLEATITRDFAIGLEEILVVEEKRQIIEYALKEELYNFRDDVRPRVYGKFDEKAGGEWALPQSNWLLPAHYELSPALIARAIATRLDHFELPSDVKARIEARLAIINAKEHALAGHKAPADRLPMFCSGCPHNTSTHVPEGSRAVAGIGCHYMATWMPERRTETFTQMGGEGVPWIGQAPFTDEQHIFANLGDGTYFHSGSLAVRASIAAGVNITYKILYNDAVAMTGGQPVDGTLTVPDIARQMSAEGARRIVLVTDEIEKYGVEDSGEPAKRHEAIPGDAGLMPNGILVYDRSELDRVQRELREVEGCTILIYDQTCASEKRRRRKKIVDGVPGFPDPARRAFINAAVCEGCGDCSVKSSCLSVEPVETDLGRKRKINQSSCNKDYSCVNGFCPSFVTVLGAQPRRGKGVLATKPAPAAPVFETPEPTLPSSATPWRILITGVGGTGVVTIGQLLGMAAHLEGKALSVLDMAGLAQKGGAVMSHVQIADNAANLHATRIAMGEAHLVIGGDALVTSSTEALSKMRAGMTRAVIASTQSPTADFLRDPNWRFPLEACEAQIDAALGADRNDRTDTDYIDAQKYAVALLGDAIYANPFLLGWAWQRGWVPLTRQSILRAMELNGASIERNQQAFEWGRRSAHDRAAIDRIIEPAVAGKVIEFKRTVSLDETLARRTAFLTAWQDAAWAERFTSFVARVRAAEQSRTGTERLTTAVANGLFKLMSYKDEYEVARLYTDPAFKAAIAAAFEGDYTLEFHLAPPLLARKNERGELVKRQYGGWMLTAFGVMARFKFLRGTLFDPFGHTVERRMERRLIDDYRGVVDQLLATLDAGNLALAVRIANLPQEMRGYGHVKERNVEAALARQAGWLAAYRDGQPAGVESVNLEAA